MAEFYQQLKKAMNIRNISQTELCEKTGIPKSAMSQYISGSFKPKQKRTFLIANALNVNEAWLMGYDDIPMEKKQTDDAENLTPEDLEAIELLKKLTPEQRIMAEKMLKSLIED